MNSTPRIIIYSLILILIIMISFVAGFVVNRYLLISSSPQDDKLTFTLSNRERDKFFDNQSGTVQGKVTNVSDNTLTIQNGNGSSESFPVSKSFLIFKSLPDPMVTPSSDLKKIELNKNANINFITSIEGQFEVDSIHY